MGQAKELARARGSRRISINSQAMVGTACRFSVSYRILGKLVPSGQVVHRLRLVTLSCTLSWLR